MILSKKKINLPFLLSLIFVLLVILLIILSLVNNHHYDQEGTNLINLRNASKINTNNVATTLFEQAFVSQNNNLSYINFYIYNPSQQTKIHLSLIDEETKEVVITNDITTLNDNSIKQIVWDFDNIDNSLNKKYTLVIEVPPTTNFDMISVLPDLYVNGSLFINGDPADNILAFSFGYSSNNILPLISDRLTVYKPWIFQSVISFYILGVLLLGIYSYIIYLLTKNS